MKQSKKPKNTEKYNLIISIVGIIISFFALIISIRGCSSANKANNIAEEANAISKRVSEITNRPYLLYEDVSFISEKSYEDIIEGEKRKIWRLYYSFTLLNDGTLPGWVFNKVILMSRLCIGNYFYGGRPL